MSLQFFSDTFQKNSELYCLLILINTSDCGNLTKHGTVAHLGERFVRNEEVASSILVSSTILLINKQNSYKEL